MENSTFRRIPSKERNLTVRRDGHGYGLTLFGDQPVFVQTVKPGGAASRAGIRENDIIVKVNGQIVTQASHTDVVNLIQSQDSVVLTVSPASKSSSNRRSADFTHSGIHSGVSAGLPPSGSPTSSLSSMNRGSKERITAPLPANSNTKARDILRKFSFSRSDRPASTPKKRSDKNEDFVEYSKSWTNEQFFWHPDSYSVAISAAPAARRNKEENAEEKEFETMRLLNDEKLHTIHLMVEQEQRFVEQTRQALAVSTGSSTKVKQQELELAVKRLAKLQDQLYALKNPSKSIGTLEPVRPAPSIPSNLSDTPPVAPPRPQESTPPPLPARNRSSVVSLEGSKFVDLLPPPLPPPRGSNSSTSATASPIGAPAFSPKKRQNSVDSVVNLKDVIGAAGKSPKRSKTGPLFSSPSPGSTPPPLLTHHERTKSSPSSLTDELESSINASSSNSQQQQQQQHVPAVAEAFVGFGKKPGRISPRYETPPGTPPPPYYTGAEFLQDHHDQIPDGLVTWPQLLNTAASGQSGNAGAGVNIIGMEDDDDNSESEDIVIMEMGGGDRTRTSSSSTAESPFNNLRDLCCHNAHLTVFANYVISNSDPACLMFYLITEVYILGTLKEMQKWAYEIHSSFLVPEAPLRIPNLEQNVIHEIDRALMTESDNETLMRKLFWKARAVARKELKEQLSDFREKRTAGLGHIYGPPDSELKLCVENRNKELQVIDDFLTPVLDSLAEDIENATDRSLTIASSLATIISKNFNAKNSNNTHLIEKCPTFVSKEKRSSTKAFFGGVKARKNLIVQGHNFELKQYLQLTHCNQSQEIIRGIGPQGYHCSHCGFDVSKKYVHKVEETCVGPSKRSDKNKGRNLSRPKFIDRILPDRENVPSRKQSSPSRDSFVAMDNDDIQGEGSKLGSPSRQVPQGASGLTGLSQQPLGGDLSALNGGVNDLLDSPRSASSTSMNQTHSTSPPVLESPSKMSSSDARGHERDAAAQDASKAGNKVDRSQSLKDQQKARGSTRERRKHSDPSIPRGKSDDIEGTPAIGQPSSGSSTSSLSARSSVDSPAGSQEIPSFRSSGGGFYPGGPSQSAGPSSLVTATSSSAASLEPSSSTTTLSSVTNITHSSVLASPINVISAAEDSDFETEAKDWRHEIPSQVLEKMSKKETKRQDVINELFYTERSHVRNLKVLDRLFYRPLLDGSVVGLNMPKDLVERLFPNLDEVLAWHTKCNQKMKKRVKSKGFPIGNIGDILSEMFDGENGDTLIEIGSTFTKNQKFSIEEVKERRRRDHKLEAFLSEQERRPECRRLQIQSILPAEHQRLVKYPLLLEQLAKQTSDKSQDSESLDNGDNELAIVKRCVERTREILESIDKEVAEAQNVQRLAEIQKNLDTSGLEKMSDSPICAEYRNVDLTKHRMIYDGALTMKLGDTRRFKTIDLHVILLEDCIMLLQKQDEKYLLKFHTSSAGGNVVSSSQGSSSKLCHSPVIKFSTMLVRPVATDKRAFYLLNTTQNGPQIYELIASSTADRSQWFRHITEASNAYKSRESSRRSAGGSSLGGQSGARSADQNGLVQDPNSDDRGNPAGRSQSFHEKSNRTDGQDKEAGGRQAGSPGSEDESSISKKTGGTSSGSRKRLQRVEILKIAEPCPLIDPSQVVVTRGEILMAEPVLTPIEKLRRKDQEVADALEEKQRLIAEILHIPLEDYDHIADMAGHQSSSNQADPADRDAREVLLAALAQAKSLAALVNESLNLNDQDRILAGSEVSQQQSPDSETSRNTSSTTTLAAATSSSSMSDEQTWATRLPRVGPSTQKLTSISRNMNSHLTTLLAIIQERDAEREQLKRELQRTQDQIHSFINNNNNNNHSSSPGGRNRGVVGAVATTATSIAGASDGFSPDSTRPASFVSVEESSGGEQNVSTTTSEKNHESEDEDNAPESNKTNSVISTDPSTPSTEVLSFLDTAIATTTENQDQTNISTTSQHGDTPGEIKVTEDALEKLHIKEDKEEEEEEDDNNDQKFESKC